jgi:hypothetical protein
MIKYCLRWSKIFVDVFETLGSDHCNHLFGSMNLLERILYGIITIFIKAGVCTNHGKFKTGDRVKYNWKAKIYINSAIEENKNNIFTVREVCYPDKSGIDFEDDMGSADAFWLCKAHFWEKWIPTWEGMFAEMIDANVGDDEKMVVIRKKSHLAH